MTDRQLQFRVGLFVLIAVGLIGVMVFQFGEVTALWQKSYQLAVHFESAPGIHAGSPVKMSGLTIGSVRAVKLDEHRGGIGVILDIKDQFPLRANAQALLSTSLLGDSVIEFTPGTGRDLLQAGTMLEGQMPSDPFSIVNKLDTKFSTALASFEQTSSEWRKVGENINGLLDTNRGNVNEVVENAANALHEFTQTMQAANKLLGDPKTQSDLRQTLAALPELANETRQTITLARRTLESAQKNFDNLQDVTDPLSKAAGPMMTKLDRTLTNLDQLSSELAVLAKVAAKEDGSLRKLASDPELYRNLNRSAESLSILLNNLDPIVRDMQIFSDKIARHPELMGVSGAWRGSSGLKEVEEAEPEPRRVRPDDPRRVTPAASTRSPSEPGYAKPKMMR